MKRVRARKRLNIPTEEQEQIALFQWMDICLTPEAIYWHTPNGGNRSAREAARFKAAGVVPGIPDIFILHRGQLYAIELKRLKGGRTSKVQFQIITRLKMAGAVVRVCHGRDDAIQTITQWGLVRHGIQQSRAAVAASKLGPTVDQQGADAAV